MGGSIITQMWRTECRKKPVVPTLVNAAVCPSLASGPGQFTDPKQRLHLRYRLYTMLHLQQLLCNDNFFPHPHPRYV